MSIQDKALVLQEAQDLSGAATGLVPYTYSNSIDVASVANVVRDVGLGMSVYMEFEVTTSFTGFTAIDPVSNMDTPMLIMGVALAGNAAMTAAPNIVATVGWPITIPTGDQIILMGMLPSDAASGPRNLFAGDIHRVQIPSGRIGLPWFGDNSSRFDYLMSATGYLSAVFIQVNQTAQLATAKVSPSGSAWSEANFATGAITSRIVIDDYVGDAGHSYRPGMKVQ